MIPLHYALVSPSPFPFHGIFSSFGQEYPKGTEEGTQQKGRNAAVAPQAAPSVAGGENIGRIAVDIFEQDNYYIIRAPIAGVHLSDIDIEITDNALTIRGIRRQTETIPEDQYYLEECFWGQFSRSVTLPFTIDPKKVKATFNRECILKILIPKEEKVKIVRINDG